MRTIKFRGKSLFRGEWRVGSLITCANGRVFIVEAYEYVSDDSMLYWEVDPATVGQFTGLTDKDGKKIYEGDILKIFYNGKSKIFGVVKYRDTYFFIDDDFERGQDNFIPSKTPMYYMFIKYEFEVVGNIHDNPELLK